MHGFTDEERERIREELVQTGRELLLQYGPKKTTVEDITEPVGIAKPTFYQFFDAKSDLYLVILQRELEEYMANVRSELEGVDDPREGFERLFWCYAEFGEGNPFIQQTIIQGNYRDILRNASPGQIEALQRKEMLEFLPLLEALQAKSDGPVSEMDPFTVLGLMGGSIGVLMLHRDEFEEYEGEFEAVGAGYYEEIQEVLISTLARGLTVPE